MSGALARYLDGSPRGRLHLQHGPIDLLIGLDDAHRGCDVDDMRQRAYRTAWERFSTILDELVRELPLLRRPAKPNGPLPNGAVARRMVRATEPFAADYFITPMAAVAGAVADEILAAMLRAFGSGDRPERIYVNNGGDIAVHLDRSAAFRVGMSREDGAAFGALTLSADDPARGVATSGRGGRSLSMGIADSVTVVAADAAAADAAATLIANAVDLPGHSAIARAPADSVVDDSDLGDRLVVTGCGALAADEIDLALRAGLDKAELFIRQGLIDRSALFLGREGRLAGRPAPGESAFPTPTSDNQTTRPLHHA